MNPEVQAREIMALPYDKREAAIIESIRIAIREEREACAKEVESYASTFMDGKRIEGAAVAIRARTKP